MNQHESQQFLKLYQAYRYEDQLKFYKSRRTEFTKAQTQMLMLSIGLLLLTAIAGALTAVDITWLKFTSLLCAAICPVLSSMLTAYNTLYGFEHQAKLYRDTIRNLNHALAATPDVKQAANEEAFAAQLKEYVQEVESIFQVEQGQWGQLAKGINPLDT